MAQVVELIRGVNWPGRQLELAAVETPLDGAQEVRLRVGIDGREDEVRLLLQYGGFTAPDAEALRGILRALVALGQLPDQEHWISGTWRQRRINSTGQE